MKVLRKIFLILCRVFHALYKRKSKINIDIDHDGSTDISIDISADTTETGGKDNDEM